MLDHVLRIQAETLVHGSADARIPDPHLYPAGSPQALEADLTGSGASRRIHEEQEHDEANESQHTILRNGAAMSNLPRERQARLREWANGFVKRQTGFARGGDGAKAVAVPSALLRWRPTTPGTAWRWSVVAAVCVGLVLAALGPFGSYMNGGIAERALYWVGAMLIGVPLYGVAFALTGLVVAPGSGWRFPALLLAALLASVPQAVVTRLMAYRLWPMLEAVGPSLPLWFVQTALIGGLAMSFAAVLASTVRSAPAPDENIAPKKADPVGMGGVLALQMEDHYVRVHRSDGSDLLLMPLGRAIAMIDAEGLRTHRSWWVARRAVESIEGDARSMRVRLSNGLVAPVARSAVIRLKTAGWLEIGPAAEELRATLVS